MSKTALRTYVSKRFSAEKVRITHNGKVHVLGTMPNTNQRGWWFAGFYDNLSREMDEDSERNAAWSDAKREFWIS